MRQQPVVTDTRKIAQSRIFHIEEMDITFPNGATRTYERLLGSRQDSVIILPFVDDDTILLIREYAAANECYELSLPKGMVDAGEKPLDAANRELQEETGYAAAELRYLHKFNIAPGYICHTSHAVVATGLTPSPLQGDEPEQLEIIPWKLANLDKLLRHPDFTDARAIATLLLGLKT
ncbi:MAG: ADP compounds hydrolase NudE [Pseudomonadota bacterium]|nr:ADP compounds hydrolase NudE [Pseudomonadota bacterium]